MFHRTRLQKVVLLEKVFLLCSEPDRMDDILLLRADMRWPRPPLGYGATLTSFWCKGGADLSHLYRKV